ncbi:MAG: RNA-binding transcriptional accessory protein, partial [Cohnella sp.]|nr:RNA-binding transcriptional accessory protein [Cohnella sp.]
MGELQVTAGADAQERMIRQIAAELGIGVGQVRTVAALLDDGNTIPFIARYRKEMTGELDENQLRAIDERRSYLKGLEDRKGEVIRLIEEQGKLTPELQAAIEKAVKLQEVEDLYRPYRQKRKTRASVAKERGLEPLSQWMMKQPRQGDLLAEAAKYMNAELGVNSPEDAVQGACDIIAENVADEADIRKWVRRFTWEQGVLHSKAKNQDAESVYEMYYQYSEPVKRLPPHRVLAINRGEREEVLGVSIDVQTDRIHAELNRRYIRGASIVQQTLAATLEDAYKRLIAPSIEREIRGELTEKAEEHAIGIFSENLRNLLLQPPVKGRVVLGVDPAYRTGCK